MVKEGTDTLQVMGISTSNYRGDSLLDDDELMWTLDHKTCFLTEF